MSEGSDSYLHYNLDLNPSRQIAIPDFLDSVRTTKVISDEDILMKWFDCQILKASEDHLFIKLATSKTIYGLDRNRFTVLWKLNFENNNPNFPKLLYDFAIRHEEEELYIWDYHKKLFYVYNFDGDYVRNIIPENLPERDYFSYYNSVQDEGIMFHLQGTPEHGVSYSEQYKNKIAAFYSFSDIRFSKLMTINQGSPERNRNMSRFLMPSLNGKLHYFYNFGHEVYQMKPDTIQSIINLCSNLFFDPEQLKRIDNIDVHNVKRTPGDLDYVNQLLQTNKFGSQGGFIEKGNYYALILMGTPGDYFFLLSKNDSKYKFCKIDSDGHGGFAELEGSGCFKTYRLHQMPDGRVYSITDGYHFNESNLDCVENRIINLKSGESISDEDVVITEYFFPDKMELRQ